MNVSPQKRKYDPESKEYAMNKYSKIAEHKNLSFPWKSCSLQPGVNVVSSILDILNSKANGDYVSVKEKVISKSKTECVYSSTMQKLLKKSDLIVADSSSAIRVTIWEDKIDKVQEQTSYLFEGLRVGFFKSKYLNTTKNTNLEILNEDIELSPESEKTLEALNGPEKTDDDVSLTGKIIGAEVTRSSICINCKYRMCEQTDSGAVVKCSSCNVSMLKQNMSAHVMTSVIITNQSTGECAGRYLCPTKVFDSLFSNLATTVLYNITEKEVAKLSSEMITETLLRLEKVRFTVSRQERIVQSMEILDDQDDELQISSS